MNEKEVKRVDVQVENTEFANAVLNSFGNVCRSVCSEVDRLCVALDALDAKLAHVGDRLKGMDWGKGVLK